MAQQREKQNSVVYKRTVQMAAAAITALKTVRNLAAVKVVAALSAQTVVVDQARLTPNPARGSVMNFFLNNPIEQTRLSDEQLEKLD